MSDAFKIVKIFRGYLGKSRIDKITNINLSCNLRILAAEAKERSVRIHAIKLKNDNF